MGPLYTGQLNSTMPSGSWPHTHMFKQDPKFAWYRWSQAYLSKVIQMVAATPSASFDRAKGSHLARVAAAAGAGTAAGTKRGRAACSGSAPGRCSHPPRCSQAMLMSELIGDAAAAPESRLAREGPRTRIGCTGHASGACVGRTGSLVAAFSVWTL